MEYPSAQEPPLPDPPREADHLVPPALRFARGMGIFLLVFLVFFTVQTGVFIQTCRTADPAFTGLPFGQALADPAFLDALQRLSLNGDAVSAASLWSGLAGTLLLLLLVRGWKGAGTGSFLGMRRPSLRSMLTWTAAFIALAFAVEGLSRLTPWFETDFMIEVVGSSTDRLLLYLGIGIMPAIFEELLLRGLLFGTLRHIADEHTAVAITAGSFAVMHLQYTLPILFLVLAIGIVLGYARSRSGSLWLPIALHMANNVLSVTWPS